MTTTIKYIGAASTYFEAAVTGKQSAWKTGQLESRNDYEAQLLLGTGLFATPEVAVTAQADAVSGKVSSSPDVTSNRRRKAAPPAGTIGHPVIDFSAGFPSGMTYVAQGGTVNLAYNPTGWHDGTGCLDFTPTGASPDMRAFLNSTLEFQCRTDDGWSIEFMLPVSANKASSNNITVTLGKGAVSTALPANRTAWRVYAANGGADYNMEGVIYKRLRWDIANTDLKMGPVETNVPTVTGTGVTKNDTINWLDFFVSDTFLGKTIKFKMIRAGGRARSELVITYDNASRLHTDWFLPSMMAKGWQVSPQFLTAGYLGTADHRYAAWLAGSDMNANDIVDRNINVLDYATMEATAKQMWADLAAAGFAGKDRGQTMWVYNNNGFCTEAINALVANGFVAGRAGSAVGRFTFTEGGVHNSMRLGALSWDGALVTAMKDQIDRLVEYGCTMHVYFHKVWPKAQLVADLPAATAIGATESPLAYYNRMVGLAEAATTAYMVNRGINDQYTSWMEDLEAALVYAKAKVDASTLDVLTTSEWMARHALYAATP